MSTPKSTTVTKPEFEDEVTVEDSVDSLLARAARTQGPREIVIAPVQLHRRSLKRRITEEGKPLNRFEFTDESTIATEILRQRGRETRTLDRVDRFLQYQRILDEKDAAKKRFELILGCDPRHRAKVIEQARVEIFAITNVHPDRIDAYRETAEDLPTPVAKDAIDVLEGVLSVQLALRRRTDYVPSQEELVKRATRRIERSDGEVFESVYPQIEQVSIVGLSNVPAPIVDLVTALSRYTDVSVELVGRAVTSDYLKQRLQAAIVPTPGEAMLLK